MHLVSFDTLFSRLKSIQNRYLPFFFLVMTTGALHGLLEGWITPSSSIFSTSVLMIFCIAGFLGR